VCVCLEPQVAESGIKTSVDDAEQQQQQQQQQGAGDAGDDNEKAGDDVNESSLRDNESPVAVMTSPRDTSHDRDQMLTRSVSTLNTRQPDISDPRHFRPAKFIPKCPVSEHF